MLIVALPLLGWLIWLRPEFAGGSVDYIIVGGRSMLPTLHGGDLVVVQRRPSYRVGDVVAYRIPNGVFQGRRIIHRIVGGNGGDGFVLRGDNNAGDDLWRPHHSDIEGKLWKRVPAFGRLVALARAPAVLAAVAGGFAFAFVMTWNPPAGEHARSGSQPVKAALSATTGLGDGSSPRDPAKGQLEKSKTPPSEDTRR